MGLCRGSSVSQLYRWGCTLAQVDRWWRRAVRGLYVASRVFAAERQGLVEERDEEYDVESQLKDNKYLMAAIEEADRMKARIQRL